MTHIANTCHCCSGKEYEFCCKPLHEGALPKNALELMRSRYSAYALNIPNYLVATTHPASPQYSPNKFSWKRSLSEFSQSSSFEKLQVLDFKEYHSIATVTFTAYLSQHNQDASFTEKSYFEKINGRWLYRNGHLAQGYAPELVTAGDLKVLPLAYYGDPILRKRAASVSEITSDIRILVEEMIDTMDSWDGLGLAAPQIHQSIRLFVIRPPKPTAEDKLALGEAKVFINPELSFPTEETSKVQEGCLSILSLRATVERPKEVTVKYTNLDGNEIEERFSGWEARIIMHENDHLDGIFFTDRLTEEERLKFAPFLERLDKRMEKIRSASEDHPPA